MHSNSAHKRLKAFEKITSQKEELPEVIVDSTDTIDLLKKESAITEKEVDVSAEFKELVTEIKKFEGLTDEVVNDELSAANDNLKNTDYSCSDFISRSRFFSA